MPCTNRPTPAADQGFVTIEYLLAVGISLVVLVVIANVIVFEYGHGVVRAAVGEGVRVGARASTAEATCQAAAQQVIDDLLGGHRGSMGSGVSITCIPRGNRIEATARARFRAWLQPIPDWSFTASASAELEAPP